MLNVLAEAFKKTEGRIQSLTKQEAALIPIVYSATARRFDLWQVYVFTRFYLTWAQSDRDEQDVVTFLAAFHEKGRYPITAWPADRRGSWPLLEWPRIERVYQAIEWQDPEMRFMARRGQGEGSIYQRRDGLWVATVNLGWRGGRRVRRSLYARTRKQAHDRLTSALHELQQGVEPTRQRETVAVYLAEWLAAAESTVRHSTHRRYRQIVQHQLVPHLGRIPLAKLTPGDVEAMLHALADEGMAPRTVHHARTVLRTALARAMRHGLVVRNAAALAAPPRVAHREIRSLDPDQVRLFLATVKGHPHEALLTTAVATGLRQGELLGLRWPDVDLAAGTITVRHALQWIDGSPTLVETKTTKSRRTIPLPKVAAEALASLWAQRSAGTVSSPYLFIGTAGQPLRGTVALRALEDVLRTAGLPRVTFHALRHTAASLLLAQGVHPRVVMELLGHSTIALTMNTYSHVIPALEREAAERMDALLAN